jgi:predicted adenine nucleotide alpha hydrolase (AANH) superfamily ATPase
VKVVLHICCGVCAAGAAERLISEGHEVYGFFYNPNIYPQEEYEKRLKAAYKTAEELGFPLVAGLYTPEEWSIDTGPLANEPEGGRRCEVCFRHRLKKTFLYLQEYGYDAFTTTLTISPHKSAVIINKVGQEVGGDKFLVRDFKKKAGFQRATELAKKWALHRQDYCGCIYSMRKSST